MKKLGWHTLGSSWECECGKRHALPIEKYYVGDDAAKRLSAFARDRCGRSCLVISDENTRQAGGESVLSELSRVGKTIQEKVYTGGRPEATIELTEKVAALGGHVDFFVAIGSGTLCDIAKYAGSNLARPVLLFATAPSMNGYTSALAALMVSGVKLSLPCAPAIGVFADPNVLAAAPPRMTAAGVGDIFSKCSAGADWFTGHFLRGEYYCPRPAEFLGDMQDELLRVAPSVGKSDPGAIAKVMDGLSLTGFSMVVAGSSAPSSGGEHRISHYLDMKHGLFGTKNDFHGTQVGVATVHCLRLWEEVLNTDFEALDFGMLLDAQPSESQIKAWIEDDWEQTAPQVLQQWREKAASRDELMAELHRIRSGFRELREGVNSYLLPHNVVAEAISAAGGPTQPDGLDVPREEYEKALKYARFLRKSFTVLDLTAIIWPDHDVSHLAKRCPTKASPQALP